jgi:NADPH:quinone reductase-like Zn-dependent oxidoreductase
MRAMAQRSWAQGEPLVMTELPTPTPRAGELVVEVQAIGVNPVDWKMRARGPMRLAARLIGPPPPVVVGIDFAGVVTAVGAGTRVRVGDRVVGGTNFARKQRGSQADTVVVRDDQVATLPEGFDMVVAGALPVAGVTASMCVGEVGRLQAGQRALVLGASGGVGHLVVQFVRHAGGSAVGVCSTRNLELVRSLGATAIDYTQGDPLVEARALGPFDLVIDCVGGYGGMACRRLLARGGRHVMIAGETVGEALNGLVPPFRSKLVLGRPTRARLEPVVTAVASGAVKVRIEATMPLTQAEAALARSREGRLTGKLVLLP